LTGFKKNDRRLTSIANDDILKEVCVAHIKLILFSINLTREQEKLEGRMGRKKSTATTLEKCKALDNFMDNKIKYKKAALGSSIRDREEKYLRKKLN
jgi:hypothetical protein